MRLWLGWLLLVAGTTASYCGTSGVPFSIEVLPSGAPVLGCAQPTCMARPMEGEDSVFHSDSEGSMDGFFREGDRTRSDVLDANKMRANCSSGFNHLSCTKKNQWVGGIDFIDHPRQPLVLQCCTFEGLRFSQDVGVTTISAGEAVTGGEVVRQGRQISFDVIANVRKVVDPSDPQTIAYEVTVRRMNCLPDPPEIEVPYDEEIHSEVVRVLGKATNGTTPLGHEGHLHMELEKEMERDRGHYHPDLKRKPRKKPKHRNSIHPDRPESYSYGATIFDPLREPAPAPVPHPRRIVRPPTTTLPPTLIPEESPELVAPSRLVPVQIEAPFSPPQTPSTPAPTPSTPFTFATLPMFTFPTLPPFVFPTFPPATTPAPLTPPPQPLPPAHAFGVQQANGDIPIQPPQQPFNPFGIPPSPPNPFANPFGFPPHQQQQYQHQSPYGIQSQNGFGLNPFAPQPPSPVHHVQFGVPQHHSLTFPPAPQHAFFNPFGAPPAYNVARTINAAQPGQPGMDEKPEIVEPSLPPTNQQLGALFQPPPFRALGTTLQNFQIQGRR